MKNLIILFLMSPFALIAQGTEPIIFENVMISPHPAKVLQFESAVAAHNQKYHPAGGHEARVYEILSGPNAGKYIWSSPTTWSAMDARSQPEGHSLDWIANVTANTTGDMYGAYWRLDGEFSRFPQDFMLNKLLVWQVGVERGGWEKIRELLGKVNKVHSAKLPDVTYGVYINEVARTSDGNDLAIVWFFENYAWMGVDSEFGKLYAEVHGDGSWMPFLDEWLSVTRNVDRELWLFRKDLSGVDGKIISATRQ